MWAMIAVAGALPAAPALAGSTSGSVAVSLVIEPSCHLDARPLSFPAVPGDGSQSETESSLAFACTPNTAYVVSIDDGQHASFGMRQMANLRGQLVAYELYSDAARTRRWGAGPTQAVAGQVADGGRIILPIYGQVPNPTVMTGAYSDLVTVTIAF